MDVDALRDEFPITRRWTYLNHAAFSPQPRRARRALDEFFDRTEATAYEDYIVWFDVADRIRDLAGRLLHTRGTRIAITKSTSEGIGYVAGGLDWRAGDNVVTIAGEFPASVYPWMNLAPRGVERRVVPTGPGGRYRAEDVAERVDARTRVLSLSAVSFSTGFRAPLRELGRICRAGETLFVVDGIQALGAVDVDVEQCGIDVLSAHAYKWLMGGTGIGIVAMSDRALGVLRPAALGWRSIDHWKDVTHMLDYRLDLPDEARRFEPGMLNFPGMILLEQSLGLILEVGMPEIERRVLELTARLCDGLVARGYHPVSARGAGEGSGIVAFEPAGVRPTSVADLYARRIVVSGREGRIRVSPHFYNTAEEVDALLDALP